MFENLILKSLIPQGKTEFLTNQHGPTTIITTKIIIVFSLSGKPNEERKKL